MLGKSCDHVTFIRLLSSCHLQSLSCWEKPEKQEVSSSEPQRDFKSPKTWGFCLRCNKQHPPRPASPHHTPHTSLNGNGASFQRLVSQTICIQGSVLRLVQWWQIGVFAHCSPRLSGKAAGGRGLESWSSELGLRSLIPSCCGLCQGRDEHFPAFSVLWLFFGCLFLMAVSAPPTCATLHCVCLTAFMEQPGVLVSCGTPGVCLSTTKDVVPPSSPIHHTQLPWRGLLPLVGITTERAAACLPPRLIELGCCQPAVGRVPNAADLAVIDIYNLKAISQMTWRFSNPLNSLQNIKHMASIHAGDSQEIGNSWVFQKGEKQLSVLPCCISPLLIQAG